MTMTIQLEYFNHLSKYFFMLALCVMLSVTYYTQNYAGIYIIGWFLVTAELALIL